MRQIFILLFLAASNNLYSQEVIFSNTINENDVASKDKLGPDLKNHYANSRYALQSDFLQHREMVIAVAPNLLVNARIHQVQQHPAGSVSYSGILYGELSGEISFSKYKDRVAGMVLLQDGRKYMIDQTGAGIFAISLSADNIFKEMDASPDFIEINNNDPIPDVTSICDLSSTCPSSSVIDIMVVYTAQAAANWGGVNNTVANITQAVNNMTISMTNSGVNNVSFRLVHTTQISYTESGSFSTDLGRLAGTSDGYMDNVHALRNQYGADLVSLIIGSPTSSCGIGYLNTSPTSYSASSGFNVTLYSCAVGNFTLSHECGHNMGLRHDWYVDGSTTPCSHHHGYVNQVAINQGGSSPASARWRTIMAYNDQCSNAGFSCTRINRWSNPQLNYYGDPTGRAIGNTQPSDEAYAFYRMACLVAAFRAEVSSCQSPAGLNTTSITSSSATLNWSAVAGAISYDVDYKQSSSPTWINAATGTVNLSVNLAGLAAATQHDWRVRANCASAISSYTSSMFTTTSSGCNSATGLTNSNITATSATISWVTVGGAISYDVQYKQASSPTWINAAIGTTALSVNLSGLSPSTLYDWQVRANCTGISSVFAANQFTTLTPPPCPGPYDISTNGNTSGAANIPMNTDIKGLISPKNDIDHYRFVISTGGTITLSLTTLPANFNLALLNSNGQQLAKSENNGTANETINATVIPGTYYAKVYPRGKETHASLCYTLRVQTGTAGDLPVFSELQVSIYPNPTISTLNILIDGIESKAGIKVYDTNGKLVAEMVTSNKITRLNTGGLAAGLYLIQVNEGKAFRTIKFIKE